MDMRVQILLLMRRRQQVLQLPRRLLARRRPDAPSHVGPRPRARARTSDATPIGPLGASGMAYTSNAAGGAAGTRAGDAT